MKKRTQQKGEWMAFEWPGVYYYQIIVPAPAWAYDFAKYTDGLSKMAIVHERGTSSLYVIREEYEEIGEQFFKKVKRNPGIMYVPLRRVHTAAQEIFQLGKSWNFKDLDALSDGELLKLHKSLFRWDQQLWCEGQIQNMLELHNNYLTQYVKSVVAAAFPEDKRSEIFGVLTTGAYQTITERHDHDFVKIVSHYAAYKKFGELEKKVNSFWKRYTWMTHGWAGPAISRETFLENIQTSRKQPSVIRDLVRRRKDRKTRLVEQKKIYKKFSKDNRKLVMLLRDLLDAKAERVDAHSQTYFLANKIHASIARRTGLSINQIRSAPQGEVKGILRQPDSAMLNKVWDYVLIWYEQGVPEKRMVGTMARRKFNYIKKRLPVIQETDEISGELAYPGNVKGNVRIILNIKDAPQFQEGEILVTRITDPSYVSIMKKAKAIITDIGGITSHAAIVSRELQKPCVVGTKIGTKVLKDGDRVEVDAEKGVIKKL